MSGHVESEPFELRAERASTPLNPEITAELDAPVYTPFQQLKMLCSGFVTVLDIVLCLISAALMYLCQCFIKALENVDERNRTFLEEQQMSNVSVDKLAEPIDSPLEADEKSPNAPTYKALYENEVEINHRVFQEMIVLQHKLEDNRTQELVKPSLTEEFSESTTKSATEAFGQNSAAEFHANETSGNMTGYSGENGSECTQGFSADVASNQSWQSGSSLISSPNNTLPSSPDSQISCTDFCKPQDVRTDDDLAKRRVEVNGFEPAPSSPPRSLSPIRLSPPQSNEVLACLPKAPAPHLIGQRAERMSAPETSELSKVFCEARRETMLPTVPLRDPPRRMSHLAEKLLEEIVVGRARLRPRTQGC